jgi:epoxyqueuosine reductase
MLKQFIIEKSRNLGIDVIGFGSVELFDCLNEKYYDGKYSIKENFSNVKTIISAGLSYRFDWNNISSDESGYIARYTTANFYKVLSKKLKKLAKEIKVFIENKNKDEDFFRIYVNSKINDKLVAYVSGIGYFAENSLICTDELGEQIVLGEILIDCEIETDLPQDKKCGSCKLCINSCPTGALKENGKIDKSLCIQHLTTQLDLPEKINGQYFSDFWKNRFYGCTNCIDICPQNEKNIKQNEELVGFIGTTFDVTKILDFKKDDYKKYFEKNQLSAGWVKEVVLARNGLLSLYGQKKFETIKEYLNKVETFNWDMGEEKYLKEFIKNFLNL